jgi:two-component system, OmpR family, phosphate regulon response regulator PhoB
MSNPNSATAIPNNQAHLLVVEDEPAVAALLTSTLHLAGFELTVAQDAAQAQAALDARSAAGLAAFDAAIVDWMLPVTSGIVWLGSVRQHAQHRSLPVLMLTAKAHENDKIMGLEAGADDYLTKPFSPRELVARIKALLRRAQPLRGEAALTVGAVSLNPAQASVVYQAPANTAAKAPALRVALSHTEFKLLHCLMLQPQRVHSRANLLAKAWEHAAQVDARTIDAHIKRLRQALAAVGCEGYIHTVRGMGYSLSAAV